MAQTTVIAPTKRLLKTEDKLTHNVCAYCRVSTEETDQRNSLIAQKQFFQRYFNTHPNWENVGIYADEGLSGTSLEKRDQFNDMLNVARNGGIEIILTKEVSRFSRNVLDLLNIVEELRKIGVYVWFLSEDINTQNSDYREKITQIATNAEQESLRTSRRVRWGQQQQMELGTVFGRKEMYGYNIVRNEFGIQCFEVIEEEAEIIKKIFEWFSAGDGTYTIARRLEQAGIKTKRYKNGWSNTVILRILRNEKYVGDLMQGKTYTPDPLTHKKKYNEGESHIIYIKDHHPESAIIDREMWDKVQALLEGKTPSKEIKEKHVNRYWTSGKIFCGICGGRYVSYRKKQKNTPYKAWVCFENHQRGKRKEVTLDNGEAATVGCDALRVNDRVLKTAIHDIITQIVQPHREKIIKELQNEIKEKTKPKDNSAKIASIEKQIEETNEMLAEMALQLGRKVIPAEVYKRANERAIGELNELRKRLRELQEGDNTSEETTRNLADCLEEIKTVLDLSSEEINEGLYERITRRIVVYPNNVLEFHLSFMPRPIFLQYRTSGKGEFYSVEFDIIEADKVAELIK